MSVDSCRVVEADLGDPVHRAAVLEMTRAYARDPTLEVQEHNQPALALYGRLGFTDGQYAPQAGRVLFREKRL